MADNKVNWGLCKLYYAVVTETGGVVTYGTPVALPGAVNMSASKKGDPSEFEADNITYFRTYPNEGYNITLENANIPDSFLKDVLGMLLDANKVLYENADAEPKKIALLGQFQGDQHNKRFVFYYCTPDRPSVEGSTSKKKEPKTQTINLAADARPSDGYVKASTTPDTDTTAYNNWFSAVQNAPATNANSISPTADEFSKAAPADVTATITGGGTVAYILNNGKPLGITEWGQSSATLTVESDYLAALDNGVHTLVVAFTTGNSVTLTVTVGA